MGHHDPINIVSNLWLFISGCTLFRIAMLKKDYFQLIDCNLRTSIMTTAQHNRTNN